MSMFFTSVLCSDCKWHHHCGHVIILQLMNWSPLICIMMAVAWVFIIDRCLMIHWRVTLCMFLQVLACFVINWPIYGPCLLEIIVETVLTYSWLFYVTSDLWSWKVCRVNVVFCVTSSFFQDCKICGVWASIKKISVVNLLAIQATGRQQIICRWILPRLSCSGLALNTFCCWAAML